MTEYVNVKIPKELSDMIDIITEARIKGYRNRGEFVADAVREKLKEFEEYLREPRFKHINVYENHATIWDNTKRTLADVYFHEDKAWCDVCDSTSCEHVKFALSIEKVRDAYRKKGLKIPELKE